MPTIIVERNERPGDSWRNRYKSLCLHDPVWYDHLPYIKFPENWPVFSPKDKIGEVIGPKGKTIRELEEETGATIEIAASSMPVFKAGKALKAAVN